MRSKLSCVVAIVCFIAPARAASASVDSDLKSIYAAVAPKLALNHDGELARRVDALLQKQSRYLISQLHPWERDASAKLLLKGASIEFDIRSNAHTAFGLAVLARAHDDAAARDSAIAILRFLLPTHGAGEIKCADGKQWHNQWQSAFWAFSAGKAAWLLWDDLDPRLRWLAARMICDEADRFVDQKPPMQIERDTKAEENAWNSTVVALAFNMFPEHPHHQAWRETAIRWQINSLVTARDREREDIVDGKPLRQWLVGANLYDDYTLENHDRVHPDYMGTMRLTLCQEMIYGWARNPPPQAIFRNAKEVYAGLKKFALPDGNFIYPSGQDWHIHRNGDWVDLHTSMALLFDDPQAARLLRISLDAAEKMAARSADGSMHLPDEVLVWTSHAIFVELYADAYLNLRAMGEGPAPIEEQKLWRDLAGVHIFQFGKFAVIRSEHSIATFSWGRQVMGMVVPLSKDLLLTPNVRGLIGNIELASGKSDQPMVRETRIGSQDGDAFAIAGILSRAGGAIEQRFAFVALADGRTIYVDTLKGVAKLASADLGLLGVLNDSNWPYHSPKRVLDFASGQRVFRAADAAASDSVELSSPWYHVDGLGIACLKTSGKQVYHAKPSPIRARLEQVLVLNAIDPDAAGSAQTVLAFFPNADADQTRDKSNRCKLSVSSGRQFSLMLDDGKTIAVDLDQLTVELK